MKRILQDQVTRPTRVYETDTGYLVKSRIRYRALNFAQWFFVMFIPLAAVSEILDPESTASTVNLMGATGFFMLIIIILFMVLPLRVSVRFDVPRQRVYIAFGLFKRKVAPIDSGSIFVFDNIDKIEYRHGLNSSAFAFGLKLPTREGKDWDNARAGAVVTTLNAVTKLAQQAIAAQETTSSQSNFNPLN